MNSSDNNTDNTINEIIAKAGACIDNGDDDRALELCKSALTLHPDNPEIIHIQNGIYTLKGDRLIFQNEYKPALTFYVQSGAKKRIELVRRLYNIENLKAKARTEPENIEAWFTELDHIREAISDITADVSHRVTVAEWNRFLDRKNDELAVLGYDVARKAYREGRLQQADAVFDRILTICPGHTGALVLYGMLLLEDGRTEDAIERLYKAYQSDPNNSVDPLINALQSLIGKKESNGDYLGAAATCQRIVDILPAAEEYSELFTQIKNRQGDILMKGEAYGKAIEAYRQAGNDSQIEKAKQKIVEAELLEMEKKGQKFMREGWWEEALNLYEILIRRAVTSQSRTFWEKTLDRCREEVELGKHFEAAKMFVESKNWSKAQKTILEVINRRPVYRQNGIWASELLDRIVKENAKSTPSIPLPYLKTTHAVTAENMGEFKEKYREIIPGISRVKYSPRGDVLEVASNQGIYTLDPLTLKKVGLIKTQEPVECLAFSNDGSILAFGAHDGVIHIRRTENDNIFWKTYNKHEGKVNCLALFDSGHTLVSGGEDHSLRFWNTHEDESYMAIEEVDAISDMAVDFDRKTIVLAIGRKARIRRIPDLTLLRTLSAHERPIRKIALSPNRSVLATAGADAAIIFWDMDSGKEIVKLNGHQAGVESLAFSPDGTVLVSGGNDQTLRLWKVADGSLLYTISRFEGNISGLDFEPDGATIVSISNQSIIQLWGVYK